jgi:hypothetical protein
MLVRLTPAKAGSDSGNSTVCIPGVVMTKERPPPLRAPSMRSRCTRVPGPETAAASTVRKRTAIDAKIEMSAPSPARLRS